MIRLLIVVALVIASFSFVRGQAQIPAKDSGIKFVSVDVELDPKGKPLGAYQFEFGSETRGVTLVGITAGRHAAFAKTPPYYDPAALQHDRVILAAFSTDADLPKGPTVVATLNLMLEGDAAGARPQYAVKLQVAADGEGKAIDGATVKVLEGAQP